MLDPDRELATVYEVWEWDGTALNASGWRVQTFANRAKAQACVDALTNEWNTRRIKEVHLI